MRKRSPKEILRDWLFEILMKATQTDIIDGIYRCEKIRGSDDPLGLSSPHQNQWTIYIATTTAADAPLKSRVKVSGDEQIKTLLHELLHVVLMDHLRVVVDDEDEEEQVQELEDALYSILTSSQKRQLWFLLSEKIYKRQPQPWKIRRPKKIIEDETPRPITGPTESSEADANTNP